MPEIGALTEKRKDILMRLALRGPLYLSDAIEGHRTNQMPTLLRIGWVKSRFDPDGMKFEITDVGRRVIGVA